MDQFQCGSFRCGDESGSCCWDFFGKCRSSKTWFHSHPLDKRHDLQCKPALCLAPCRLKRESSPPSCLYLYLWLAFVCLWRPRFVLNSTLLHSWQIYGLVSTWKLSTCLIRSCLWFNALLQMPQVQNFSPPGSIMGTHCFSTYPPIWCCSTKTEKERL